MRRLGTSKCFLKTFYVEIKVVKEIVFYTVVGRWWYGVYIVIRAKGIHAHGLITFKAASTNLDLIFFTLVRLGESGLN